MIIVKRKLTADEIANFRPTGDTKHLTDERKERMVVYQKYLSTNFIEGFLVDNGHRNGAERHFINENGLAYIYNDKSKKFITITHLRSGQLYHYFKSTDTPIPMDIKRLGAVLDYRNKMFDLNNK